MRSLLSPGQSSGGGGEDLVLPPLLESSQSSQMLPCVLLGTLSLPTLLVSPENQASLAYQDNNNYRWGGGPQSGTQYCQSPGMFTEFLVRARHCSRVGKNHSPRTLLQVLLCHHPRPGTQLCGQQERPGLPAPALVSASWPKPGILRPAATLIWGFERHSNL